MKDGRPQSADEVAELQSLADQYRGRTLDPARIRRSATDTVRALEAAAVPPRPLTLTVTQQRPRLLGRPKQVTVELPGPQGWELAAIPDHDERKVFEHGRDRVIARYHYRYDRVILLAPDSRLHLLGRITREATGVDIVQRWTGPPTVNGPEVKYVEARPLIDLTILDRHPWIVRHRGSRLTLAGPTSTTLGRSPALTSFTTGWHNERDQGWFRVDRPGAGLLIALARLRRRHSQV